MGINQAALKQKYKTAAAAKSMSAAARALKNVGFLKSTAFASASDLYTLSEFSQSMSGFDASSNVPNNSGTAANLLFSTFDEMPLSQSAASIFSAFALTACVALLLRFIAAAPWPA